MWIDVDNGTADHHHVGGMGGIVKHCGLCGQKDAI